jgi:hypothetical protein
MRKRFRTRQAVLPKMVSGKLMKFACQAALLPSVLLVAVVNFFDIKCDAAFLPDHFFFYQLQCF